MITSAYSSTPIVPYWSVLKNLSKTTKLKLIALLSSSMVDDKADAPSPNWASKFAGAWKDNRTTEEIINDIRSSRTKNTEIDL